MSPLNKLISIVFDAIFVVADKYIKFARYILSCKDWKAKMLGNALVRKVWLKCSLSVFLMMDQDSLFTSKYWSQFCYHLRIRLKYGTAFYPQTNG